MPRKTNLLSEVMEIWRTLSTNILWKSSKYLNHVYENIQTCSTKVFFCF